jgi:hypothetical protein
MLTKSPWAKEVTISTGQNPYSNNRRGGSGYPNGGGGYPGGGGIGFPGGGGGIGFPGGRYPQQGGGYPNGGGYPGGPNGGNYPQGGGPQGGGRSYHATLRWESAQTIQDALRLGADDKPNPDFAKYYVLNLIGDLPDANDRPRGYNNDDPNDRYPDDDNSRSSRSSRNDDDDDDRQKRRRQQMFREFTKLERKDGALRLEKVEEGSRFGSSSPGIAFYFSRRDSLSVEDKVMSFYTKIGSAEIRAKFTLKEMMYQGKLAL